MFFFSFYNVLRLQDYLGPEIVSHFVMHGTNVAEIVKHLISVLKKNEDDISYIFLEALKRVRDGLGVIESRSYYNFFL